jgi:hypothetical protein
MERLSSKERYHAVFIKKIFSKENTGKNHVVRLGSCTSITLAVG